MLLSPASHFYLHTDHLGGDFIKMQILVVQVWVGQLRFSMSPKLPGAEEEQGHQDTLYQQGKTVWHHEVIGTSGRMITSIQS